MSEEEGLDLGATELDQESETSGVFDYEGEESSVTIRGRYGTTVLPAGQDCQLCDQEALGVWVGDVEEADTEGELNPYVCLCEGDAEALDARGEIDMDAEQWDTFYE